MKALLKAIDDEMRKGDQKLVDEAKRFGQEKINDAKKRAALDNAQLMSIEAKNIDREMRRQEEGIREAHLLELVKANEEMVGKVWEGVRENFLSMPKRKAEYGKFMESVLGKSKKYKDYVVILRKEDLGLWKGAKTAEISGGAIFRSPDGRIEADFSLDGIVRSSEGLAKAKISEALFG
jgi:vacuolar-type H+-ATPase subunit E/Vma4